MKNFDLNAYGVMEMKNAEMQDANGGSILGAIVLGVVIGLVISAVDNWEDIREGYCDAINDRPPRYECN